MADRKTARDQTVPGGNEKSSGKGGGKSAAGGVEAPDPGNARLAGEDPSPDNRRRGEVSRADRP
jgi:hypothetical protein